MKTVVIFGAGASYAEAIGDPNIPPYNLPPLDKDFLQKINDRAFKESGSRIKFDEIDIFLKDNYNIDVLRNNYSLEFIYNLIYTEAINEQEDRSEINHLLKSLTLLIRDVIKNTTNIPKCNNPLGICGLLNYLVKDYPKNDLDIITFNYDLLIERTLDKLQGNVKESKYFDIKNCYPTKFINYLSNTQKIPDSFKTYMLGSTIKIYKLHGSLNWFIEEEPNKKIHELSEESSNFYLVEDKLMFSNIDYTDIAINKKYTIRPMIVPPAYDKNNFYKEKLKPSWDAAQTKLSEADRVIVFGYSLPEADMKAHSMFLSALSQNKKRYSFEIIDPNPQICQRYIEKLHIGSLKYFKSVAEFV